MGLVVAEFFVYWQRANPHEALGIEPDHVPATFLGQLALPWQTVRALFWRV
jgi:hypothetical protein